MRSNPSDVSHWSADLWIKSRDRFNPLSPDWSPCISNFYCDGGPFRGALF